MRLHRHKWCYLSKENATITREKTYGGIVYSTESIIQEVTYVKRYCKRCGEVNVQTVDGKLTVNDMRIIGIYGTEVKE